MEISWTPKPGDRLVRLHRRADLERPAFSAGNGRRTRRGLSPALIVIYAFVALVLSDVVTRRRFGRFSLTTKLVVAVTALVLPISIGTFLVLEYSNPGTQGDLPTTQKVATAAFEPVSARSGGFSLIDHSETGHAAKLWTIRSMLVGGASASAAGGVKINTLAVMFIGIWSAIKGSRHASAFGREISDRQVMSALMIGTVAVAAIFGVLICLSITDSGLDSLDLLFEGVSAFDTVGLTSGATSQLSIPGQCLLMLTMLVGRLGPLTIGLAMAHAPQPEVEHYRYPEEYVAAA